MFVGFPLGGLLSLSIMARAAVLLGPAGIEVDQLSQVAIPVALGAGRLGLAVVIAGFCAVTFGTAMETSMSCNYAVAQYSGGSAPPWRWPPCAAARWPRRARSRSAASPPNRSWGRDPGKRPGR